MSEKSAWRTLAVKSKWPSYHRSRLVAQCLPTLAACEAISAWITAHPEVLEPKKRGVARRADARPGGLGFSRACTMSAPNAALALLRTLVVFNIAHGDQGKLKPSKLLIWDELNCITIACRDVFVGFLS